jgi:hypothetical protein
MKKLFFISIACGFFCGSNIHGDYESPQPNIMSIYKKNPHRIYFGPVAFWLNINTPVKNVKIEDTKFFWGLGLGYEYLKPKAVYAGINISSIGSDHGFRAKYQGHYFPRDGGTSVFADHY